MLLSLRMLTVWILAALAAALPVSATKVNVKYAEADYESWQTWAFEARAEPRTEHEVPGRAQVAAKVRQAITERLAARGYEPAGEGETPDFLVAIDGAMREVFDVRDVHVDVADHVAFVMEGGSSSYREGTLMIRILDAASGDLVWTGWVVEKIKNPEKPDAQIRRVVRKILRKFPPEPR